MNVFRILADLSHGASVCVLILSILRNKSAEGVSLLTQILYTVVFCTRYLDLFWVAPWWSLWNTLFKIFFIGTAIYILWLMKKVYPRTKEKEYAWKLATGSLAACLLSTPIVMMIFRRGMEFPEILWTFSIELESVCVLPQLLLLRQTSVPTVINSYYLVMLGSYRFLYILNWIVRAASPTKGPGDKVDPIAVIFGVVQTALYVDFAWVYWSRQRVKIRGGAVVDSDDLSKSFLVRRIIGRGTRADRESFDGGEEDDGGEAGLRGQQENGVIRSERSWGPRGISVSADDTLHDHQRGANGEVGGYADSAAAQDAQMIDPAHFEDEVGPDDNDDEVDAPPPPPPPVAKDDKFKKAETKASGEESSSTVWAENTGDGGISNS